MELGDEWVARYTLTSSPIVSNIMTMINTFRSCAVRQFTPPI